MLAAPAARRRRASAPPTRGQVGASRSIGQGLKCPGPRRPPDTPDTPDTPGTTDTGAGRGRRDAGGDTAQLAM